MTKAIGQARILAIGYLTFSEHARGDRFMVLAGDAAAGPQRRGLHVVLVREPGQSYGSWKTCEIEENALYATQMRRQVQKKIVFRSLDQVLEAIEFRNALHTHVTQIRDFTDDDFYALLSELVA